MAEKNQIYKCNLCGNIIEVVNSGNGNNLICCGQPMHLLKENTIDASKEKHVPIIEIKVDKIHIKVGSVDHPMLPEHYIEFIELIADNVSYKKFLKPGDKPEAEFCIKAKSITAREYCNLHGLWKS